MLFDQNSQLLDGCSQPSLIVGPVVDWDHGRTGFAWPAWASLKNSEILLGSSTWISKGLLWPKLDSLNLYVGQLQQQLLSFESDLSKLYPHLGCTLPQECFVSYWPSDFESLYAQASQLGVGSSRLKRARRLATENEAQACRFLTTEIRNALTERIAHLRRRLRV